MANIQGTNVTSGITPFTTADTFPTHYAEYGKGGFRTVNTIEERNAIPYERREEGMLVYVINDDKNVHTYQWFPDESGDQNKEWKRSKMGGGDSIPIYDSAKLDELRDAAEDDYIFIPDKSDFSGYVSENTYTTTKNGSYVDILFSAIRELQSEVARLRNAFNYGIHSYSGTDTAMSRTLGVYKKNPDEEPLWAIDEDGLSLQKNLISNFSEFDNKAAINHTTEGLPYFVGDTTWTDGWGTGEDNTGTENLISEVEDSKLFLYLTSNSINLPIILKDKVSESLVELKLDEILEGAIHLDWYNILVVISREQVVEDEKKDDTYYFGSNFIWISVSNPETNNTIAEGYLEIDNRSLVKYPVTRSSRFTITSIRFTAGIQLSKANIYSKYQDFSKEVIPSTPTDSNFSYKAAHITIRSVSTYSVLDGIKDQLLENELIFVEDTKKLYIKNNERLVAISGAGNEPTPPADDTMTAKEILQILAEKKIIYYDPNTESYTGLQPLTSITLINEDTGKKFEISVDAYGNLNTDEIEEGKETLSSRLNVFTDFPSEDTSSSNWNSFRGFVGQLCALEEGHDSTKQEDTGLFSDRIKIGSFYAPSRTQLTFGCSHGFIELENTSGSVFQLDGCYLHYSRRVGGNIYTSHLALTGEIPANGTYLIRCKQYSNINDPNTFIVVENYDMEWYEKDKTITRIDGENIVDYDADPTSELVDLSHSGENDDPHGLVLTYGKTYGTKLVNDTAVSVPFTYRCLVWAKTNNTPLYSEKSKFKYWPRFIDAVYYNGAFKNANGDAYWATASNVMASKKNGIYVDAIYKNTFELDPAKQAYQALTQYDSSRYRNANTADYQYVLLNNEYISFPKTDEVYPVNKFTPKASFEGKNVLTDKNKLDPDKPNCVTCSFGINPYTTRTFNWVSSGYFDEYVWVREKKEQDTTSWNRFSSYTEKTAGTEATQNSENRFPWRKEFDADINNAVYKRIYGYFPGDKNCTYTSHKCILDLVGQAVQKNTTYEYVVGRSLASGEPDPEHTSEIMTFTLYPENYPLRIYQTTDQQGFHWIEYQAWGAAANYINDQIKADIEEVEQRHATWEDSVHAHAEWESAYADWQQRHQEWIDGGKVGPEPQAPENEPPIPGKAPVEPGIIPVLMNTGDMTQSGCRVNEWIDYYNAGAHLFDHLEQVNCVGNNDLCGTIVTDLGTGDDAGKSNSFYFHVFYCYEVDISAGMIPIIRGKYIPSLYHIDFKDFRIIMVNSEITYENCKTWYKMVINNSSQELLDMSAFNRIEEKEIREEFDNKFARGEYSVINVYTGWTVETTGIPTKYINGFTSIYTMLYHMLVNRGGRECIVACHEMPFTVITTDNLSASKRGYSRSASDNSLVGSHLNQLNTNDDAAIYWFSRLLESTGVRLCIGGHKHTYTQTWPVRENYYYKDGNSWKTSLDNGPMIMEETLSNDKDGVRWILEDGERVEDVSGVVWQKQENTNVHLSKFPIIEDQYVTEVSEENTILPGVVPKKSNVEDNNPFHVANPSRGVIYFMCQATGFKLMSNKELPAQRQIFSNYLPKSGNSKADEQQRCPMYAVIDLNTKEIDNSGTIHTKYNIFGKLIRLNNIQVDNRTLFNQLNYGTDATEAQNLYDTLVFRDNTSTVASTGAEWYYGGWHNTPSPHVSYPTKNNFPDLTDANNPPTNEDKGKTFVAEDTGKTYKIRNIGKRLNSSKTNEYAYVEGDVDYIIYITIE